MRVSSATLTATNRAAARTERDGGSFRDPAGFVFRRDGRLFRQINEWGRRDYEQFVTCGLRDILLRDELLVAFAEVDVAPAAPDLAHKVIEPEALPFISYPYEWCFGQLREAALTTLAIEKRALKYGMTLKDASAYNIQFGADGGQGLLMDTLSFEAYDEGEPWIAYRQFCQHFVAPLALMAHRDVRLGSLLRLHIDGVPLDLASCLLPLRSYLNFGLLSHVHLHARAQRRYADRPRPSTGRGSRAMSRNAILGLIDNLESTVRSLAWRPESTPWADYYDTSNYSEAALEQKRSLVARFLEIGAPAGVWDLGSNTGLFSRAASQRGIPTVAFDLDHGAVELNYRQVVAERESHLLPLVLDLGNPSPQVGWDLNERQSTFARGPTDMVLALALVHHLAIGNNVPLGMIADAMARLGRWLVIEFVPKSDSQVQRLLATRADIFEEYDCRTFETVFGGRYTIHEVKSIEGSERKLYLMERRGG